MIGPARHEPRPTRVSPDPGGRLGVPRGREACSVACRARHGRHHAAARPLDGGYAARKEPAQGAAQPLHAKAMAVADPAGRPAVVVTIDVLGLTEPAVDRIAAEVHRQYGLPRERLLLCSSHTHSGPIIRDQLAVAYDLKPSQWDDIRASTRRIEGQVVDAVGGRCGRCSRPGCDGRRAAPDLRRTGGPRSIRTARSITPCPCSQSSARTEGWLDCSSVRLSQHHAAGVLRELSRRLRGRGEAELERRHAGVTALFVQGCGADANPQPRGTIELAVQHGRALADAVDRALGGAVEVAGPLRTAFTSVSLTTRRRPTRRPGGAGWKTRTSTCGATRR